VRRAPIGPSRCRNRREEAGAAPNRGEASHTKKDRRNLNNRDDGGGGNPFADIGVGRAAKGESGEHPTNNPYASAKISVASVDRTSVANERSGRI